MSSLPYCSHTTILGCIRGVKGSSRGAATECGPGRKPGVFLSRRSQPRRGERLFRPYGAGAPKRHLTPGLRPGLHSVAAPRLLTRLEAQCTNASTNATLYGEEIMLRVSVALTLALSLALSIPAFGQISNATVSGTIEDATRAVLPGVTVTATNTATGIVTNVLTNEAGAYNFASLLPGPYKVTAELPGFQTRSYDITLGNAQTVRLNFTLSVASVGTAVEVSVAVDTLLATSSASIGEVLSQQRAQALPLVGNNVLSLVSTMSGARLDDNGVTGTFAGMSNYNVNVQRDGIDSSASARYMQAGIQTSTLMNPDLIGELRLIVAPADAVMGRGNGQMIVQTRSGTNQLRGSAVWSIRNSALDANTWNNNRQVDPKTSAWKAIPT